MLFSDQKEIKRFFKLKFQWDILRQCKNVQLHFRFNVDFPEFLSRCINADGTGYY